MGTKKRGILFAECENVLKAFMESLTLQNECDLSSQRQELASTAY